MITFARVETQKNHFDSHIQAGTEFVEDSAIFEPCVLQHVKSICWANAQIT